MNTAKVRALKLNNSTKVNPDEESLDSAWLEAHPALDEKRNIRTALPEVRAFCDQTWPTSMDYLNPLNATFLVQFSKLNLFNKKKKWIIRDGLVPLLWFFKNHPHPKNVKSKIYIDSDLTPFVPRAWQDVIGSFKIVSTNPTQHPKKIFLCGTISESFMGLRDLSTYLTTWIEQEPSVNIKSLPKLAFLPARYFHGSEYETFYHVDFMTKLCSEMGTNIEGLSTSRYLGMNGFQDHLALYLSDKFLISDSGVLHHALARGATIWGANQYKPSSANEIVPLSSFHGFELCDSVDYSESCYSDIKKSFDYTNKYYQRYLSAIRSQVNTGYPWPNWFSEWAHVVTKKP